MKKFEIEIIETLTRIVEVEAENTDEAIQKAKEMRDNCDVILDSNDFADVYFQDINIKNECFICNSISN